MQPNSFQFIQLLYYFMLAGQVLMGFLIFYLMQKNVGSPSADLPYHVLIPMVVVLGIALSRWVWGRQRLTVPVSETLTKKLMHFRTAFVIRAALAEGANLLALVLTFLFGSVTYLLWFAIGLVAFVFLKPTRDGFAEEYRLSESERSHFSTNAL